MLREISPDDARRLKDFLAGAGYDEATLRPQGYLKAVPSTQAHNLPRLLERTREPNCLNVLLRCFWLGSPQGPERIKLLPEWFTDLALSVGLLTKTGSSLVGDVMLFPCDGFLTVCDHTSRMGPSDPDFVLWPNPTTHMLSRFTSRRPSRATLDLGTGNAMQALSAARHSDCVVATDLNARAIDYARFAAALNGLTNVECRVGDGFGPVAGRRFDLIVSNPPFFIGPVTRHVFCDNPMELDQFCRSFVKEASNYLEEGGYFQVICEWAQVRGQSWQERVTEWVEGTGCDAWILRGHSSAPADYAHHQLAVPAAWREHDDEASFAKSFDDCMAYYRENQVEAIHDGLIALRRRSGKNWCVVDEFSDLPKEPFGESILTIFAAQDFLRTHTTDEQLLAAKLRLAPGCRLEQFLEPSDGAWQPTSLTLRLTKGLSFFVSLAPSVAQFLSACDGSRTFGELIQGFAPNVEAPFEKVQSECLAVIRKLVDRGFLVA